MTNPTIVGEFEQYVDGIITDFGAQTQAIMDIISGNVNPSGLLPFNMPANMETVEAQCEDVPHDMKCYEDELGNVYKFAYGLDFNGVINDSRVAKYKIK
ncbi:Glycosyl hydrolase family 3 C-terminal domain [Romboutsia hominis]|uniref:Glycosyl hydrolase family 3 C-terminal domain n=2 Tax=Peptostreptococcaceae TaxID=186804 RepID=A0A2P2BRR7_9FIRM|nr:Glycosyl hydrolase family 3 C-terminal domain [Romboutsia hominis]